MRKILLADDHPLTRRGLRMLISSEMKLSNIDEADNIRDLYQKLENDNFTHLILDLQLGDTNTADQFSALKKKFPGLAILIYSMHGEDIYAPHLLRLGARGYLNKQSSDEDVMECLKAFFTGKKYLKNKEPESTSQENPFSQLSPREVEVLHHLLQGKPIKEISALLNLKSNTVATFKIRIYDKLKVSNVIELSQLASLYNITIS